jgi:hypothetical protein
LNFNRLDLLIIIITSEIQKTIGLNGLIVAFVLFIRKTCRELNNKPKIPNNRDINKKTFYKYKNNWFSFLGIYSIRNTQGRISLISKL